MNKRNLLLFGVLALSGIASAQTSMNVTSCWNTAGSTEPAPNSCVLTNDDGIVSASLVAQEKLGYAFKAEATDAPNATAQAVLNYKARAQADHDYVVSVSAYADFGATYVITLIVGNRTWNLSSANGASLPQDVLVHVAAGQFVMAYIVAGNPGGSQESGASIYLVPKK